MTFIILEDEMIAAQRLACMVKEIYPAVAANWCV